MPTDVVPLVAFFEQVSRILDKLKTGKKKVNGNAYLKTLTMRDQVIQRTRTVILTVVHRNIITIINIIITIDIVIITKIIVKTIVMNTNILIVMTMIVIITMSLRRTRATVTKIAQKKIMCCMEKSVPNLAHAARVDC